MPATVVNTSATIEAVREAALIDYKTLVENLADGQEVDTADLTSVRLVAGRSLIELETDVDRLAIRRELATKLARLPDLAAAATAASAELDRLRRERTSTISLLDSKIEAANVALTEANRQVAAASDASAKLRASADPGN